ncbi:hypothetical protein ABU553_003730 [Yersinia enterocolitica]
MLLDHRSLTPAELRDIWQTDPRIAAGMFSLLRPCSIDGCASDSNHLLPHYFTREDNCLELDWHTETNRRGVEPAIYFNPPFSKEDANAAVPHNGMANFFKKARQQAEKGVYSQWLFRARPGEGWFPWYLASRIYFIVGRVAFVDASSGQLDNNQTENHAIAEFIPGNFPIMAAGLPLQRDALIAAGERLLEQQANHYAILSKRHEQLLGV